MLRRAENDELRGDIQENLVRLNDVNDVLKNFRDIIMRRGTGIRVRDLRGIYEVEEEQERVRNALRQGVFVSQSRSRWSKRVFWWINKKRI